MVHVSQDGRCELKRILLVGASSILGNAVIRELRKHWDMDIFALGRRDNGDLPSTANSNFEVSWLEIEFGDISNLKMVSPDRFDLVLVCLGYISEPLNQLDPGELMKAFKLNLLFPVQVIDHLLESKKLAVDCRVVFFSSALVALPPFEKSLVYSNFKKNLELLVKSLSRGKWKEVDVIFVRPGYVPTKINQHLERGLFASTPEVIAKRVSKSLLNGKRTGVIYSPFGLRILIIFASALPSSLLVKLVQFAGK